MKLKDLTNEEILKHVLNSDKLSQRFEQDIQEHEMDYISEICHCFKFRCAAWSIGPYERSYFECTEASEFVYCAREMADKYSASNKTLKVLDHVEKLRDTNLFEYYADKLAKCIEADLLEICYNIENMCHDIYCKKVTPELLDFCECFADWAIDDVMINEDGKLYQTVYL